ncbi:hypothetical protein [Actinoplanes sp. NPDC051494]|uniref:hypothetical protein n=1 Tax=Actinoplanes sp. NPDC051494 TaxID=3363907 RepID=UPI0037A5ECC3
MTVSVILGLCLQAISVCFVHVVIRGDWIRRPAALMLLMAVLGHGVTEVMQWIWPGRNAYRRWLVQADMDDWVLLMSVAIAIYAVAYSMLVRSKGAHFTDAAQDKTEYVSRLPLKFLVALTAPLLILTWQGRGALGAVAIGQVASRDDYVAVGLAGQFLVPVMAATGAVILVRYGVRWLIPLFAVQGIMLSLAGTRTMIVATCLLSLLGARLCGVRPSRRQAAWVALIVIFFAALISSTRFTAGRESFTAGQGADDRINGLFAGLAALPTAQSRGAILNDFVYRFDCNTYGALVLQGLRQDVPSVGLETLKNSMFLVVPSFLAPDKLDSAREVRNEEAFIDRRFGIDQQIDWLPGMLGAMTAYFGPLGLLTLSAIFGLLLGSLEIAALHHPSPARFVLSIGVAQCALAYEAGPQALFVTGRGVVAFVALIWLTKEVRMMLRRDGSRRLQNVMPSTLMVGAKK